MKVSLNIMPVIERSERITLFNEEPDKILPTGTEILGKFRILTIIAGGLQKRAILYDLNIKYRSYYIKKCNN